MTIEKSLIFVAFNGGAEALFCVVVIQIRIANGRKSLSISNVSETFYRQVVRSGVILRFLTGDATDWGDK